jgi:hypothetical protein
MTRTQTALVLGCIAATVLAANLVHSYWSVADSRVTLAERFLVWSLIPVAGSGLAVATFAFRAEGNSTSLFAALCLNALPLAFFSALILVGAWRAV